MRETPAHVSMTIYEQVRRDRDKWQQQAKSWQARCKALEMELMQERRARAASEQINAQRRAFG